MRELLRLMRYVKPYTLRLGLSVLLMAGVGFFEAFMALLIGPVFDRVLNPKTDASSIPLFRNNFLPQFDLAHVLQRMLPVHNIWTMVAVAILIVTFGKAAFEYAADYPVHYICFPAISDPPNQASSR